MPAGHDMEVKMPGHPGPGALSQIESDIESVRMVHRLNDALEVPSGEKNLGELLVSGFAKRGNVPLCNDQEVPGGIRKTV